MNRTPEQWAALNPDAFLSGSIVQAKNVIAMMQQDIAALVTDVNFNADMVTKLNMELRAAEAEADLLPLAKDVGRG